MGIVGALGAACLLGGAVGQASAASGDATAQKLEKIRARMEAGQTLFIAKSYSAAAREFEDGYKENPYSAFLFNAGVCYQKLDDLDRALEKFREYLRIDPNAPDADKVRERVRKIEALKAAALPGTPDGGGAAEGGTTAPDAGAGGAGGAPGTPEPVDESAMKSLVVIETEPEGAPVHLFQRTAPNAPPYKLGTENPGWRDITTAPAPANLTLEVGHYHVVVEKFRDFNVSETDLDVLPGHVHHIKANLSQGAFMAFLRVSANIRGAYVYLDDDKKTQPEWGVTPYGQLVPSGDHTILVEAPGWEPLHMPIKLSHGEQKEITVRLARVGFGFLRVEANAPSLAVRVDGQAAGLWKSGEEPLMVQASAGSHRITITSDGRKTFEGDYTVPAGQVLPIKVRLVPRYPRGAAWTQLIIGAAFLGASTYFGLESNRLHDELASDRGSGVLEEEDERKTRGQIYAIGADVGMLVGGALVGLSIYNFIRDPLPPSTSKAGKPQEFEDPKKRPPAALVPGTWRSARRREPAPSWAVTPMLGAQGAGVGVGGSF